MEILLALVHLIAVVCVYLDVTKRDIGKTPQKAIWLNVSATHWGLTVVFTFYIGIVLYLVMRKKLIERAQIHPVITDKSKRIRTLVALTLITVCLEYFFILSA